MRTEEERMQFCGTICIAARRCGIYGRFEDNYFRWFDPMASHQFPVPHNGDKKATLELACDELVKYLEWKTK